MQMSKVLTANYAGGRGERAQHLSRGNGWRRPGPVHSRVGGRRAVCHAESTHPSIRYVNEEELEVAIQSREKPLVIDLCVLTLAPFFHSEAAGSFSSGPPERWSATEDGGSWWSTVWLRPPIVADCLSPPNWRASSLTNV